MIEFFRFGFTKMATESPVGDYFRVLGQSYGGVNEDCLARTCYSDSVPMPAGGDGLTLRWSTDQNNQNEEHTGITIGNISDIRCDTARDASSRLIETNRHYDGVLIGDRDDVYAQVTIPADKEAFIILRPFGKHRNFDIFVGDEANLRPYYHNALYYGARDDAKDGKGEAVRLPYQARARTYNIRIHSARGVGGFELFVAVPVVSDTVDEIEVGFGTWFSRPTSNQVERVRRIMAQMLRYQLEATDGQYLPTKKVTLEADWQYVAFCPVCYDVLLKGDNLMLTTPDTACASAQVHAIIQVRRAVWADEALDTCFPAGSWSEERVGTTLVHEWFHYEHDPEDEEWSDWRFSSDEYSYFGSDAQKIQCGHSLMGTTGFSENNVEFCTDFNHDKDHGSAGPSGKTNGWRKMKNEWPQLRLPATISSPSTVASPDFARFPAFADCGLGLNGCDETSQRGWLGNRFLSIDLVP